MTGTLRLPQPTWFVGCGNMGGAILDGWRGGGLDLGAVTVVRPSGTPVQGARVVTRVQDAGLPPKLVVLGFKPQKLDEIAPELRKYLSAQTIVVSLLAGVEAMSLRQRFPGVRAIVRAMTNLPVAVRRGVTALYSPDANQHAQEELNNLFSALGFAMWTTDEAKLAAVGSVAGAGPAYVARFIAALTKAGQKRGLTEEIAAVIARETVLATVWMTDEAKLAAVGSVAGAGPAYVARFIAALTKAGQKRGLTEEIAAVIARETVLGTVWMAGTTGEDMASIARRVASPNGTTEAGLAVLDREQALDALVSATIEAASRRGAELAEDARAPSLAESARLS